MPCPVLDSGNAKVYLSIDERNQFAACKVIRRKSACHVFHEIATLTRLHHVANIIELLGAEEDTHHIFLFFPLYDGDLHRYVVTRNRLGESESKHIMSQILLGLHYLHCLNITHRPDNILLKFESQYPSVCIADFESAFHENKTRYCSDIRGTLSYLPPEAIYALEHNQLHYFTSPPDCWSAGVVLFVMLSGVHPFHCADTSSTRTKIRIGRLDFQDCHWEGLPGVGDLIQVLCHAQPEYRATVDDAMQHVWFRIR
ncbi:kinase-like domain-containing protein [Mycena olivaceomarginata]|nr:kinase-like domain-containing protein [Mycena olivaceomarginata]